MSTKNAHEFVGDDAFWYPAKADKVGHPHFGVRSAAFLNQLTWGDMRAIVAALKNFFLETKVSAETSFSINDSERGTLGSGIIEPGQQGSVSHHGSGTTTA